MVFFLAKNLSKKGLGGLVEASNQVSRVLGHAKTKPEPEDPSFFEVRTAMQDESNAEVADVLRDLADPIPDEHSVEEEEEEEEEEEATEENSHQSLLARVARDYPKLSQQAKPSVDCCSPQHLATLVEAVGEVSAQTQHRHVETAFNCPKCLRSGSSQRTLASTPQRLLLHVTPLVLLLSLLHPLNQPQANKTKRRGVMFLRYYVDISQDRQHADNGDVIKEAT